MDVGPARKLPVAPEISFAEIFRQQARYLWRALLGLGVRPADVDDVCQEVFLVVHRRLPEFDGRALRSWLYAICLRVASDYRRSARVRREVPLADLPEAVPNHAALGEVHVRELWHTMLRGLDRLDEEKRAAFVLYEIEELTVREVAEVMGCPLQTAYSRLGAAREQMQAFFASEGRTP
ncbi:MAG TPA: RNA polymerase sigma factor [Polyangiaceae bacterium]|nr:RNA polymerase sigma factor [Polyangiaceae bacterium]